MAVVHREVVERLKAELLTKGSWGQRELLTLVGRLEGEATVPDTEYQRVLRRFTGELEEAFLNVVPAEGTEEGATDPLSTSAAGAGRDGHGRPTVDPPDGGNEGADAWTHPEAPRPDSTPRRPRVPTTSRVVVPAAR